MLSKKNRADKKMVEMIFKACPPNGKEGKVFNFPNLSFKFTLNNSLISTRISFIVPKSVAKLAVNRNLLRRRGYAVLKKYIDQFPSTLVGVFIFKKYQNDILILENEIKNALSKIN